MQIIARKKTHRLLATNGFPPESLKPLAGIRVLGSERKLGQYKLTNGSTRRFKNFRELALFNDSSSAGTPRFIILRRNG